ncbi:Geranylgeranyl transferase type-1 subunit beta [Linum perenne]
MKLLAGFYHSELNLEMFPKLTMENSTVLMAPVLLNFLQEIPGHLASTYCALAILKTVRHNLFNIDWTPLLMSMRNLQQPDGSFLPIHFGAETDLRFTYCAAAICFMLDNWSGMDRDKATEYILKCKAYDGGFGMTPGAESHGGGTFCAVASLRLMGFLEDDLLSRSGTSSIVDIPLLLEWCLQVFLLM